MGNKEKVFEDYFSELQADMVSIALEYVNGNADYIFIYCSKEDNMYSFDIFYKVKEHTVRKHKLNGISHAYDVSSERQRAMLKIGMNNLKSINELCHEYNQPMPTEMKIVYQVNDSLLDAKYSYDLIYSCTDNLAPDDIFDQWFNEIKNE